MRKKLLAALLCFAMVLSTLAGCSKTPSGTETTKSGETEGTTAGTDEATQGTTEGETEGSDKVDGKGEKITIAIPEQALVTDYEDNYFTQFLESELNIDIEFYMLPAANADIVTKLNLMANGADKLPDVIITAAMSNEMILNFGTNGVLVPLNDYVEDERINPNFNAIPEADRQQMLAGMTSADGNIYGLCRYEPQIWNITAHRLWINTAWLEALDLKVPTTTDELYDVLKAFVNDDPNGNGIKDEIGAFGGVLSYGRQITNTLMNSFTYFRGLGGGGKGIDNYLELSEDGQTVIPTITKDEFRDGLEYMHKLCSEGLLDPSMFTIDESQFKAILNAETPVVGLVSAGSAGNWTNQENFAQMQLIAPLTGPEGVCYTPWNEPIPTMIYFVTSDAENPELCYRIGEYFYNDFVGKTARYGEEGVLWSEDPEVLKEYTSSYKEAGIVDAPLIALTYEENGIEDPWTVPNNFHWHNLGPRYQGREFETGLASCKVGTEKAQELIDGLDRNANLINYELYSQFGPEIVLPSLKFTAEESEEINLAINDIHTIMSTAIAEFVTGQRSLDDAGWQDYLDDLKSVGFDRVLEVCQDAYDRVK